MGGISAEQPDVNDEESEMIEKVLKKTKVMSPHQRFQGIQEIPKRILPKTPKNNPEMDAQEAQEAQKAQTSTLTTQNHTNIKKAIQETRRLQLNMAVSLVSFFLSNFHFFVLTSTEVERQTFSIILRKYTRSDVFGRKWKQTTE